MGDAVTGINRADSASGKLVLAMLRQLHVVCNSSRCRGCLLMPDWQIERVWAVSTADSGFDSGRARRLTHRRASLAFEAPIAWPWISAFDLRFARIGCRAVAVCVGPTTRGCLSPAVRSRRNAAVTVAELDEVSAAKLPLKIRF
jgi:hypothetical protein